MDYKNTVEGKEVQKKYRDILYSSRPEIPPGHTRMDINNRAKIFSPFAALRGYEEEIRSEGRDHLKGSRIELSDEEQGKLSEQLQKVTKGMRVTIRYFKEGFYEDIEGVVTCIDSIDCCKLLVQVYYSQKEGGLLCTKDKRKMRDIILSSILFICSFSAASYGFFHRDRKQQQM